MGEPLEPRPATAADLDAAMALVTAVIADMRRRGLDQWDELYPDRATLAADIAAGHLFVLRDDHGLAAMVALNDDQPPEYAGVAWTTPGPVLVVHRLAVAPHRHRSGLGRRLMDFAERLAARQGCRAVRLDTFSGNPVAQAFYGARGYARTGEVRFRKGRFVCYDLPVSAPA